MKKFILPISFLALFVSPFVNLQAADKELFYPVEVIHKSVKVRISNIKIQHQNNQLVLSGLIKRRAQNSHVLPGHIDYVIIDKQGQIIKESAINYSASLSLRNSQYGRHFNFVIPDNLPEGSRIKLGWHKNQPMNTLSSNAYHKKNSLL